MVIQRTWLVSGRGGKLQVGAEGRAVSVVSSSQVWPASSERHIALGSIPAYTTSSLGPTAKALTSSAASRPPAALQEEPESSLRQAPAPTVPHQTRSGWTGSGARHQSVLPSIRASVTPR